MSPSKNHESIMQYGLDPGRIEERIWEAENQEVDMPHGIYMWDHFGNAYAYAYSLANRQHGLPDETWQHYENNPEWLWHDDPPYLEELRQEDPESFPEDFEPEAPPAYNIYRIPPEAITDIKMDPEYTQLAKYNPLYQSQPEYTYEEVVQRWSGPEDYEEEDKMEGHRYYTDHPIPPESISLVESIPLTKMDTMGYDDSFEDIQMVPENLTKIPDLMNSPLADPNWTWEQKQGAFDPSVWETPKQPVEQEKLLDNKLRGAVSWMEEVTCDECGGPAVLTTHPDYPDDEGFTFCIDDDCVAGGVASEETLRQVRSAPFHDWKGEKHTSAMTNKKLNEMAANLQPDRSQVVHDFGDGWTIRQPTVVGDVDRVGKLMENCWNMRNEHADPDNYGGQYDDMSPYLYEGWQEFLSIDKPINAPVQRWLADPQGIPRAAWRDNEGKAEEVLGRHNSPPQKKYLDKITEVYPDYKDPTFGLFAPYVDQRRQPVKDDTDYGPCSVCGSTETIITQPENMRFCHQCHALEDMEENLPDWRPRIITDLDEEGIHNWEQNYHQIVLGDEWWGWDEQKTASLYEGEIYDDYESVPQWRPGVYGKGFIDDKGEMYLWEVTDWDPDNFERGVPHHGDVFLGTIGEANSSYYESSIWIDPEGNYTSAHPINADDLDSPGEPQDILWAQEIPGLTHIPNTRQWVEMQGSNPDQGGFGHAQNVMDILNKKSDFDPDLWTNYGIRSEDQMELGDMGDDLDMLMGNDHVIHECPECGGSAVGLAPTEYAPSTVIWCEDCHGLFTCPSPGGAYTKEKDLDPETAKQFGWVAAMEEAKNNLWENIWTDRISAASSIGVIEADFPLANPHTGLDYGQRRPFLYSPKSSAILLGPAGAVHAEVAAWLETPEAQAVTGGISFWPWKAGEIHTYSNWDEMNAQSPLDMGPQPPPEVLYNDEDPEAVKQALAPYTEINRQASVALSI